MSVRVCVRERERESARARARVGGGRMQNLRSFDIGSRVITDFSFAIAALPEWVRCVR